MKLLLPSNIFARMIAFNLPDKSGLPDQLKESISWLPSALITSELKKDNNAVGLIPTTDIIKNNELFVSRNFGLSFEGSLCNSYLYYNNEYSQPVYSRRDTRTGRLKEIALAGDVSSIDVIIGKILFKEIYDTDVELKVFTDESKIGDQNLLMVGDKNFEHEKYETGISFAEEIIESLSLPFVNYIFASMNKQSLEFINGQFRGISTLIYDRIDDVKFGDNFSTRAIAYIKENISSLIIDFEEQDIEGINQMLRLPYYHGIAKEIVEVNFV